MRTSVVVPNDGLSWTRKETNKTLQRPLEDSPKKLGRHYEESLKTPPRYKDLDKDLDKDTDIIETISQWALFVYNKHIYHERSFM